MFGEVTIGALTLDWSRPYIMGIINVTPDSFSDGGEINGVARAVARARALSKAGADIIDVGGESTRPQAHPVLASEEAERVLPVIGALASEGLCVSVDTTKSEVAKRALQLGATIVNDISGGLFDEKMHHVCEDAGAYICGHVRGQSIAEVHAQEAKPTTVGDVATDLAARLGAMSKTLRAKTIVDPGLGFGKNTRVSAMLNRSGQDLSGRLKRPVLCGASRKRFVREGLKAASAQTIDVASAVAAVIAVQHGAHMVRVHNVDYCTAALSSWNMLGGNADV